MPGICLDLDNTIVDTNAAILQHMRRRICPDLTLSGRYNDPVQCPHDTCRPQIDALTPHIWTHPELLNGPPVTGAQWACELLAQRGLLRGYVTRRPQEQADITRHWLRLHRFPDLEVRHTPGSVTETSKAADVRALGGHLLIEDNHAEAAAAQRDGLRVILIDQPYNAHLISGGSTRAADFLSAAILAQVGA